MRIALCAGETSGDQLGAGLIHELRKCFPDAEFAGIGGDGMRAAGLDAWSDASELAVMGLAEVLAHLPRLLRLRKAFRQRVLDWKPDVYIGIDAPDFNLGVEKWLKARGVRTVHYVSPSVWAWREGRAAKIGRSADRVLCLFPMEPPIYARHGVDAVTLRRLAEEVVPALDTAASGPPGTEAPESPEKPLEASDTTDQPTEPVEESPLEGTGPPKAQSTERPPWAPFIEGSASFVFGGRNFGFDEANSPSFRATVAPGLFIDATVYPFAFMASKTDGGKNALSGLGIGGDYGQAFWADSVPCYPTSMGTCAPTTDRFTTGEYRYEVGLRWKWNIARKAEGVPELLAQLQYGNHTFFIQKRAYLMDFPFGATGMDKKPAPRDIGPPDVSYSYMSVGLGARLPFAKRFAAQLNFNWHIMLGTGDIQQPSEWGPGGAFGFRLSGHFDIMIVKGAFARITGYAEYYGLSFNQPPGQHNLMPPCPCGTTGSASDVYYGGMFGVGYRY